ncbi:MAG: glutamate--tRNA ligase [Alphaproteobacteria bacterium]|nr:glutamate--tRNA ligase [Alphaproteobacteria bacterium]OJV47079.1 MAG: glutamate--tRNA ligase [Alphaproteobacteria bacterium 43-37]
MTVITRFAPSPTGYLHIGGARTALFNLLFARHHGGEFLLRIEDTDRARSTEEAVQTIFNSLKWLDIQADEEPVFQFARSPRHVEVAHELLKQGKAYHCYCSPEELEIMREDARRNNRPPRYNGVWRDRDPKEAPAGVKPVIRLKAPRDGTTTVHDLVQGPVTIQNQELDDMVLLRADGTPTYMLSVVVDDHDMAITHVIRGDDHLTNTFRQYQIYASMGWDIPQFAHIPLIHGPDGAKLSKRHGALAADAYKDMGFLPEALCNYLLRLGWGHGDDEIISREQAISWFDVDGIGKAPSRLDLAKLTHLNAHYLKEMDDVQLLERLLPSLKVIVSSIGRERLLKGMPGLKIRAKTLCELAESAQFYLLPRPIPISEAAQKLLQGASSNLLAQIHESLSSLKSWDESSLELQMKALAEQLGLKLGQVAQPLRAALTGSSSSPSLFEVMHVLGREESLGRIQDQMS